MILVPKEIKLLLVPWTDSAFLAWGKPFGTHLPSVCLLTDASHLGWGHCLGNMVLGTWDHLIVLPHIKVLEMLAALALLHHFRWFLVGHMVLVLTDNTTVAAYINRRGSACSSWPPACGDGAGLWTTPVASYIPGHDNLIADFLSRGKCYPSEWSLHLEIFDLLLMVWSLLEIDFVASPFNHRLPRYCSRVWDPEAWAVDSRSTGDLNGAMLSPCST